MKIDRKKWVHHARELRAGGIALEIPEDDWRDPPPKGLIIRQYGGPLLNSVFDTPEGPTGFMLNLRVVIAKPGLALAAFDVEPPWEANLTFLEDPRERSTGKEEVYRLGNRDRFTRDEAINHYADSQRILRRGQPIEGFLLAWSLDSIPNRFVHGMEIPATVKIFDQNDWCYRKEISLWVDRSGKRSNRKGRKTNRAPLFEEGEAMHDTSCLTASGG